VAGSGIEFQDRAGRKLKGVPGEWHLYVIAAACLAAGTSSPLAVLRCIFRIALGGRS
jgi:hypothetical protein